MGVTTRLWQKKRINLLCSSFSRSINVILKLSWMQNSCEGGKDLKRAHNPVG